ncbi:hypothetical protein C8R43DRAFT_1115465 [Mycena crocata]|nr:hypothetical protein C8R43DRAFT_1115465 [Mycena crocata]
MPRTLRRLPSETTHASDSEPEREAHRRAHENPETQSSSGSHSSASNSPPPCHAEPHPQRTLDSCLAAVEKDLAEIKQELNCQKHHRESVDDSRPSTPHPKLARCMRDQLVGSDSPVGRLEEPQIHRSSLMLSTPEREEMSRCLGEVLCFSDARGELYDAVHEWPEPVFWETIHAGMMSKLVMERDPAAATRDPQNSHGEGKEGCPNDGTVLLPRSGYDLLHYFDLGIWGKHVWRTLVEYLQAEKLVSKFNDNMSEFPRWRGLKHTLSPTTIDYSEGQTFVDILKSSLPCLVQLLTRNSLFVRIVRVMDKLRIMLGLPVTTKTRLDHTDKLILEYERTCSKLYQDFDKDFNFLKQHYLKHARRSFMSQGTSRNMNTRIGEGFQQEVAKMYEKTNGKNAQHLISSQDKNEEAMARIKMAVWQQSQTDSDIDDSECELVAQPVSTAHWTLGAPDRPISAHRIEAEKRGNGSFRNFNIRLREYIAHHHPSHWVRLEQEIKANFNSSFVHISRVALSLTLPWSVHFARLPGNQEPPPTAWFGSNSVQSAFFVTLEHIWRKKISSQAVSSLAKAVSTRRKNSECWLNLGVLKIKPKKPPNPHCNHQASITAIVPRRAADAGKTPTWLKCKRGMWVDEVPQMYRNMPQRVDRGRNENLEDIRGYAPRESHAHQAPDTSQRPVLGRARDSAVGGCDRRVVQKDEADWKVYELDAAKRMQMSSKMVFQCGTESGPNGESNRTPVTRWRRAIWQHQTVAQTEHG